MTAKGPRSAYNYELCWGIKQIHAKYGSKYTFFSVVALQISFEGPPGIPDPALGITGIRL